ncbi:MAG: hypothetical protein ACXWQ5_00870 [Ktedonobacterales bacterium]
MITALKQLVFRPKAKFTVGEDVAVTNMFATILGKHVKVVDVTYHPFGVDGTFFKPESPAYTYGVQRWDSSVHGFAPEDIFLKRS